jgi:hypothetical protein
LFYLCFQTQQGSPNVNGSYHQQLVEAIREVFPSWFFCGFVLSEASIGRRSD